MALQFVRSKSAEWNIDKEKIAAAGGSAGACTSLWLAFHDDLKQVGSTDPVAQESTRLYCAAVMYPQTSLDPKQMKNWIPDISYGAHAFGIQGFDAFLASRDSIMPWIEEYSPYALVSKDDPPVYMYYNRAPGTEETRAHFTHSAIFGVELQKHCKTFGVKCEVYYQGAPDSLPNNPTDYLIKALVKH